MADLSSISKTYFYASSQNNKVINLKILFVHGFDILIADPDLLDKWVINTFNICVATNVEDYKLGACI